MEARRSEVKRLPHHEQDNLCTTRPPYRQGRQLTAVKVYTVNDESQHLIISGIPSLGLQDELRKLCSRFGDVKSLTYIPNYATEKFVEAYHVQYSRIQSSRYAKRQIDGRAFFGGSLHVCYAPEMESISETRNKLTLRRHEVSKRCMTDRTAQCANLSKSRTRYEEVEIPYQRMNKVSQEACIWNGKETGCDPRLLVPAKELEKASSAIYGPQPCRPDWRDVGVREVVTTSLPTKRSVPEPESKPAKKFRSLHVAHTISKAPEELPNPNSPNLHIKAVPPILRLVPSQVKGAQKKIVFHPKPSERTNAASGNQSLDITIQMVREKIRNVTVPNVKILLDKDKKWK